MQSLSEPEGYFDSDNFVSNEAAYLKILPAMRRLGMRGGAYLGVGPDQNYSYLAEIEPRLAFIVDIRRQNSLQHLYYKALFRMSPTRVEYLERLFGRRISRTAGIQRSIYSLLNAVDAAPRDDQLTDRMVSEACSLIRSWGFISSERDVRTIRYIADAFIENGPDLKFTSYNRAPRSHHPTYRMLLTETDSNGVQASYLSQEERFQKIKRMHAENRIIPVVGDFAGAHAFRSVGREIRRRGLRIRCFYASNVEFYLFRSDLWDAYLRNLRALPIDPDAYLIRAYANMWNPHPAQSQGHYMTTMLQSLPLFLTNEASGKYTSYWDMVSRDYIIR
jgi:hypothetical protein